MLGLSLGGPEWVAEPGLRGRRGGGDSRGERLYAASAPPEEGSDPDVVEIRPDVIRISAVVEVGFVDDAGPDFRIDAERVESVGASQVLAFLQITASGRSSGIPQDAATANVYDLVDGKISHIRIFQDRQEALKAVGLEE